MPIPVKNVEVKRQSAKTRIFNTLREWIAYGTLKPGEKLNDQEISDYFEVSRTPVREAIQMLEAQKLVVVYPNRATCVTEVDFDHLEKWYLPLAYIHALAAQFAAAVITKEQVEELREIESRIKEFLEQRDTINTLRADLLLHKRILDIADNEILSDFSDTLMLHVQRIEYIFFERSGMNAANFTTHEDVLEALENRDEKRAFDAMFQNWLTILNSPDKLVQIKNEK